MKILRIDEHTQLLQELLFYVEHGSYDNKPYDEPESYPYSKLEALTKVSDMITVFSIDETPHDVLSEPILKVVVQSYLGLEPYERFFLRHYDDLQMLSIDQLLLLRWRIEIYARKRRSMEEGVKNSDNNKS